MTAPRRGSSARPRRPAAGRSSKGTPARPAKPSTGWRDGLFLALACAGLAGAAHAAAAPDQPSGRLLDGTVLATLGSEALVRVSLPFLLALAALFGPAIIRWRWQAGVLVLGTGWIALVGLALLQERILGQSFDVLSCAIGFAAVAIAALALKPRAAGSARPAPSPARTSGDPPATAPA